MSHAGPLAYRYDSRHSEQAPFVAEGGGQAAHAVGQAGAAGLAARIEAHLWDEARGSYVDVDRKTGETSPVLSVACFMPLFAGIAPPELATPLGLQIHGLPPSLPRRDGNVCFGKAWTFPRLRHKVGARHLATAPSGLPQARGWRGGMSTQVPGNLSLAIRSQGAIFGEPLPEPPMKIHPALLSALLDFLEETLR